MNSFVNDLLHGAELLGLGRLIECECEGEHRLIRVSNKREYINLFLRSWILILRDQQPQLYKLLRVLYLRDLTINHVIDISIEWCCIDDELLTLRILKKVLLNEPVYWESRCISSRWWEAKFECVDLVEEERALDCDVDRLFNVHDDDRSEDGFNLIRNSVAYLKLNLNHLRERFILNLLLR